MNSTFRTKNIISISNTTMHVYLSGERCVGIAVYARGDIIRAETCFYMYISIYMYTCTCICIRKNKHACMHCMRE